MKISEKLSPKYYSFEKYVTKRRMLTYWYQIKEIEKLKVSNVLEIGVGPGVVGGILKYLDKNIYTVDTNKDLNPDVVASVTNLSTKIDPKNYDLVLCSRVLHHVNFNEFDIALQEMKIVTKKYVLITLPVDDFRLYFSFRITSKRNINFTLRLPMFIKHQILRFFPIGDINYRDLWKINSKQEYSLKCVSEKILKHFTILKSYALPEDRSHYLFLLEKL